MTSTEESWDSDTEYVVLCGPNHERVGYAPKAEVHSRHTPLHLAFSCYLFDHSGRFLVTWRADTKRTWPGVRTNSCCGHPGPREPVGLAVARRLEFELGAAAESIELVLPEFQYRATMPDGIVENELCPVYRAVLAGGSRLRPDPDEVRETAWEQWLPFVTTVLDDPGSVSPWCALQVAELHRLGPDPLAWPVADAERLPPVAREVPAS